MANEADRVLFSLHYSPFRGGRAYRLPFAIATMKIKSSNRRKPEPKFMYICNRRRCLHCVPECHHTAQIEYALYKTHDRFEVGADGKLWEIRHEKK